MTSRKKSSGTIEVDYDDIKRCDDLSWHGPILL